MTEDDITWEYDIHEVLVTNREMLFVVTARLESVDELPNLDRYHYHLSHCENQSTFKNLVPKRKVEKEYEHDIDMIPQYESVSNYCDKKYVQDFDYKDLYYNEFERRFM